MGKLRKKLRIKSLLGGYKTKETRDKIKIVRMERCNKWPKCKKLKNNIDEMTKMKKLQKLEVCIKKR